MARRRGKDRREEEEEQDEEEEQNNAAFSLASNAMCRPPEVGTSHDVRRVVLRRNEEEEEEDGEDDKDDKAMKKKLMALRYTHARAPAADATKRVRVARKASSNVVEVEFKNKEEEKSGIRYRGVVSGPTTAGAFQKEEGEKESLVVERKVADNDEDDNNVECAILFDGKTIELRVLDETVAGLRVQRKREDEEESGMVSKRLDIGEAVDVRNKRKKVV